MRHGLRSPDFMICHDIHFRRVAETHCSRCSSCLRKSSCERQNVSKTFKNTESAGCHLGLQPTRLYQPLSACQTGGCGPNLQARVCFCECVCVYFAVFILTPSQNRFVVLFSPRWFSQECKDMSGNPLIDQQVQGTAEQDSAGRLTCEAEPIMHISCEVSKSNR